MTDPRHSFICQEKILYFIQYYPFRWSVEQDSLHLLFQKEKTVRGRIASGMAAMICISVSLCLAQPDTSKVQRLTLTDGSEIIGRVISDSTAKIIFRISTGVQMEFDKAFVKEIQSFDAQWIDGKLMREDPNQTRLFFAPTARSLRQGRGYFTAYEVFFPMLAVGVTDFITVAGGISLFPGAREQVISFAPKVRLVHLENFDLACSVLYMTISDYTFGITYGVATIGSSKAALTIGLGWGFVNREFSDTPSLIVGGELRLSNKMKFITENWFPPKTDGGIISFGLRFIGDNIGGDIGLMRSTKSTGGGFPFLPWIGIAYNF